MAEAARAASTFARLALVCRTGGRLGSHECSGQKLLQMPASHVLIERKWYLLGPYRFDSKAYESCTWTTPF